MYSKRKAHQLNQRINKFNIIWDTPKALTHQWCSKYLMEFFVESTVHGVVYFSFAKRRPLETLFWLAMWLCTVIMACSIIWSTWQRFVSNPTVISLSRNFLVVNNTFPAMTACFLGGYNESRAQQYIQDKWGNVGEEKLKYYSDFLQTVNNVSYHNLKNFEKFENDKTLPQENLYEILEKIQKDYRAKTMNEWEREEFPIRAMTDKGICYIFNSGFRNSRHDRRNLAESDHVGLRRTAVIKYGTRSVLWSMIHFEDVNSYIHSPWEYSETLAKPFHNVVPMYRISTYTMLELVTSKSLHSLTVSQRHCRFSDESNLEISRVYSYTLCQLQCRMRLAEKLCGCSPYFYPLVDSIKECDISGLVCLSKHSTSLQSLQNNAIVCDCLPTCRMVTYVKDFETVTDLNKLTVGGSFYWGVPTIPKVQLQRKIIYGPVDLFVSFGGTASFFLGCSMLSIVDSVYFYTLRLVWRVHKDCLKSRGTNKKETQQKPFQPMTFQKAVYPISYSKHYSTVLNRNY